MAIYGPLWATHPTATTTTEARKQPAFAFVACNENEGRRCSIAAFTASIPTARTYYIVRLDSLSEEILSLEFRVLPNFVVV